jgi:hypothetical protein
MVDLTEFRHGILVGGVGTAVLAIEFVHVVKGVRLLVQVVFLV